MLGCWLPLNQLVRHVINSPESYSCSNSPIPLPYLESREPVFLLFFSFYWCIDAMVWLDPVQLSRTHEVAKWKHAGTTNASSQHAQCQRNFFDSVIEFPYFGFTLSALFRALRSSYRENFVKLYYSYATDDFRDTMLLEEGIYDRSKYRKEMFSLRVTSIVWIYCFLIFRLFRGILNILPKCVSSYYIMIL